MGRACRYSWLLGCAGLAHGPHLCPGKAPRDLCLCQGCGRSATSPLGQALPTGSDWAEGSEAHQGMRAKARPPQTLTGHVEGGPALAGGSGKALFLHGLSEGQQKFDKDHLRGNSLLSNCSGKT